MSAFQLIKYAKASTIQICLKRHPAAMNQSVAGFHHSERGLLSFNLCVLDGFLDFLLYWGVFSLTSSGSIISTLHLIRRRIFVSTGHTFKHIITICATDVLWNQDQSPYINFKTLFLKSVNSAVCNILETVRSYISTGLKVCSRNTSSNHSSSFIL